MMNVLGTPESLYVHAHPQGGLEIRKHHFNLAWVVVVIVVEVAEASSH